MSFDQQIVEEINALRTDPKKYSEKVNKYISYFEGKTLKIPGRKAGISTQEGPNAYQEAVNYLLRKNPVEPLQPSKGLFRSAQDFLKRIQRKNADANSVDVEKLMEKYGTYYGDFIRGTDYGGENVEESIINLIVSDGDRNRRQRESLLSTDYKLVGAATGTHPMFRHCTVIFTCTEFQNTYDSEDIGFLDGSPSAKAQSKPEMKYGTKITQKTIMYDPINKTTQETVVNKYQPKYGSRYQPQTKTEEIGNEPEIKVTQRFTTKYQPQNRGQEDNNTNKYQPKVRVTQKTVIYDPATKSTKETITSNYPKTTSTTQNTTSKYEPSIRASNRYNSKIYSPETKNKQESFINKYQPQERTNLKDNSKYKSMARSTKNITDKYEPISKTTQNTINKYLPEKRYNENITTTTKYNPKTRTTEEVTTIKYEPEETYTQKSSKYNPKTRTTEETTRITNRYQPQSRTKPLTSSIKQNSGNNKDVYVVSEKRFEKVSIEGGKKIKEITVEKVMSDGSKNVETFISD